MLKKGMKIFTIVNAKRLFYIREFGEWFFVECFIFVN